MAWYLGAGVSKNNVGMAIGTYGLIWIFWLLLNRIICEHLVMLDAYLNFAQIGRFPSHAPAALQVRPVELSLTPTRPHPMYHTKAGDNRSYRPRLARFLCLMRHLRSWSTW